MRLTQKICENLCLQEKNVDVADSPDSANTILKNLCFPKANRLICAQSNINSIRNKFEFSKEIVSTNVDILLICETKLDSSFPRTQFHIHGLRASYRFDRNGNGGRILLYIDDAIPSKLKESKMTTTEVFFVELNLRKKKWILCCSHNSKKSLIFNQLEAITNDLDLLLSKYDNYLLIGGFNAKPNEPAVFDFYGIYSTENIIKEKTCFKNPECPTCIDLILTKKPMSFQNSNVIEKGLSDFHERCITVMKMYYCKLNSAVVTYKKLKKILTLRF